MDDDRLFAYLVPYVFQKLDVEAGASAAVSALLFWNFELSLINLTKLWRKNTHEEALRLSADLQVLHLLHLNFKVCFLDLDSLIKG